MSGTGSPVVRMGVVGALVLVLCGCGSTESITETPFDQAVGDAASIMSAAGETLRSVHAEPARMTVEYGAASMINYDDQVASVPDELPTLQGAPDEATLQHLVDLLEPAIADIESPCLKPDCDWQTQAGRIDAARDALLGAIK